jgi:hypothetical protein
MLVRQVEQSASDSPGSRSARISAFACSDRCRSASLEITRRPIRPLAQAGAADWKIKRDTKPVKSQVLGRRRTLSI